MPFPSHASWCRNSAIARSGAPTGRIPTWPRFPTTAFWSICWPRSRRPKRNGRRFSSTTHSVFINSAEKTSGSGCDHHRRRLGRPGLGQRPRHRGALRGGRREGFRCGPRCSEPARDHRKDPGGYQDLRLRRHRWQCYRRYGGPLCKDLGTRRHPGQQCRRLGARRTGRDERGALGCAGGPEPEECISCLQARPAGDGTPGARSDHQSGLNLRPALDRCGASGLCRDQGRGDPALARGRRAVRLERHPREHRGSGAAAYADGRGAAGTAARRRQRGSAFGFPPEAHSAGLRGRWARHRERGAVPRLGRGALHHRDRDRRRWRDDRTVRLKRLFVSLLFVPALALAQAYPSKPVRMIVPFPPGGPADIFARGLAQGMHDPLGQPVVIENIGGVGGVLGVDRALKAAPDGYTLGFNSGSTLSIAPFSFTKLPYDVKKDVALITLVVRVPEVLAVHPSLPVKNLAELISYAKANPGQVNFGSAGGGSITHLAGELLKAEAKVDLVHVPYKGAAPAVNDLLGGQVQMGIFDVPVLLGHIRAGRLKALAVTNATRTQSPPDVPTTAEMSYPSVTSDNWYGLVVPAATPADLQKRIHAAAMTALRSPAVIEQFARVSGVASPGTPQDYAAFLAAEQAKWSQVVSAIGFKEN